MSAVTPPRVPLPHLEHPKLSGDTSFRISFLEEQAVQTTQTAFSTQLSYTFEEWGGRDPTSSRGPLTLTHARRLCSVPGVAAGLQAGVYRGRR